MAWGSSHKHPEKHAHTHTQAYKRRMQQVIKSGPQQEMGEGEADDDNKTRTMLREIEQIEEAARL